MKLKRAAEQANSAEIVASIDDLLVEILLRVPARSLIKFKSVSKHWLSLITNPQFCTLHNPNPNPPSGLFLPCTTFPMNPQFEYVHFDTQNPRNPPSNKLRFIKDSAGINILHSCNGLLLCSSFRARECNRKYYIYNPTTKLFSILPKPGFASRVSRIFGVSLAFDPAKSPHYKVVCVRDAESADHHYQIEIYSSEAGPWRVSGSPFKANVNFKRGVYWNGSIHWISTWGDMISWYLNLEDEKLRELPMPNPPSNEGLEVRSIAYFGESCGHLHLIETYGPRSQLDIHELRRDYSGWFVKFKVDLETVAAEFPGMIRTYLDPNDIYYYVCSVFSVVETRKQEDSFLVLQIPGKAVKYSLVRKDFEKICDFQGAEEEGCLRFEEPDAYGSNRFAGPCSFGFIESLCCT